MFTTVDTETVEMFTTVDMEPNGHQIDGEFRSILQASCAL